MNLKSLYNLVQLNSQNTKSDKGTHDPRGHTYIDFYDEILAEYRITKNNILEIGVLNCDSHNLWALYFPYAKIYGIDVRPECKIFTNKDKNIEIYIGDSQTGSFPEITNVDVIIDDGGHRINEQINTFNNFYHRLNPGGLYIIEDIQDLDKDREKLLNLSENVNIHDRRKVNNRSDDVIVTIKK